MRIAPPDTHNLAVGHDATHPRLTFTPHPTRNGEMDSRWWPRTDDLAVELPALLGAVAHRVGAVDRISLDPETWANRVRTVTIDDRVILLDWFGARHRRTVGLRGTHSSRLDLLVIPPNTATIVALACLTMQTLAASPPEHEQESRWEDDGGRHREPSPTLVGTSRWTADGPGQTDSW
jgi:hypothetical protein